MWALCLRCVISYKKLHMAFPNLPLIFLYTCRFAYSCLSISLMLVGDLPHETKKRVSSFSLGLRFLKIKCQAGWDIWIYGRKPLVWLSLPSFSFDFLHYTSRHFATHNATESWRMTDCPTLQFRLVDSHASSSKAPIRRQTWGQTSGFPVFPKEDYQTKTKKKKTLVQAADFDSVILSISINASDSKNSQGTVIAEDGHALFKCAWQVW